MRVLITNDDSHRSPLLAFLVGAVRSFAEVTVVVPAEEKSWCGKSMSRFAPLHCSQLELSFGEAFAVDGTPADCVNIGIHHLCEERPDLVISGINAGLNAGVGFLLCSGTVGAALEANISGVGAVAISQQFDSATMNHYIAEYALPLATLDRLRIQTDTVLSDFLPRVLRPGSVPVSATLNVNLPFILPHPWRYELAKVGFSTYGSCFARVGEGFTHDLREVREDHDLRADMQLLRDGAVTVSPLALDELFRSSVALDAAVQSLLE